MPQYPFIYQATVLWFEDNTTHHYRIAGLGFCEDLADAAKQLQMREGDTLESIEHLEIIGDRYESIIEINPDWVKPLLTTESWDFLKPYTPEGENKNAG